MMKSKLNGDAQAVCEGLKNIAVYFDCLKIGLSCVSQWNAQIVVYSPPVYSSALPAYGLYCAKCN